MYTDFFMLTEKPFNATPDPRTFYENARYREASAVLLYGIAERKGFIVLTGEVGTGKTTLLRRLMDQLGDRVRFVFFYSATLTFDQLLDTICAEFELPMEGLGRLEKLDHLNRFLLEEAQRGSTVVLLLDEAQHASPEVLEHLRLISNLETATEKLLQIVLVGQPELEAKLADPALRQVRQRVAVRYRLEPLPPDEVAAFIEYRLVHAGRAAQDLFSRRAVKSVARLSGGIPRLINTLCDAALMISCGLGARRVTAEIIDEAAADLAITDGAAPGSREPARRTSAPRPVAIAAGAFAGIVLVAIGAWLVSGDELLGRSAPEARRMVVAAVHGAAWLVPGPARETRPAAAIGGSAPEAPPGDPAASPAAGREPQRTGDSRLVVTQDATVSDAIFARYGTRSPLVLDLVREFNPHLPDLDRVPAGAALWLPPVTFETRARAQRDGTYRIVVTSSASGSEAQRLARAIRARRYATAVTRRRVTSVQELHRIEIRDLPTVDAARAAWRDLAGRGWLDADFSGPR